MNIKRRRTIGTVISLASMADIAFLLLIFFVITSSIEKKTDEGILLPVAEGQEKLKRDLPFVLSITKKGKLSYKGKTLSPLFLKQIIFSLKKEGKPVDKVQISGDRELPYGLLAPYLAVLKKNAVRAVVFAASFARDKK